jgi:Ohr subfamily peroxiredoxin
MRNVMPALYTATATAIGGRQGYAVSSDGALRVDLTIPKEMGGSGKPGATNPEQLFAVGYAACFESAIGHMARQRKIPLGKTSVTAHVSVHKAAEEGFEFAVNLEVNLEGVEPEQARELAEMAHKVCPFSRATRGNIKVSIAHV